MEFKVNVKRINIAKQLNNQMTLSNLLEFNKPKVFILERENSHLSITSVDPQFKLSKDCNMKSTTLLNKLVLNLDPNDTVIVNGDMIEGSGGVFEKKKYISNTKKELAIINIPIYLLNKVSAHLHLSQYSKENSDGESVKLWFYNVANVFDNMEELTITCE